MSQSNGQQDVEIVKIFGGPGTGKTTTMVGNDGIEGFRGVLHQMFEEKNAQELMLIAYTRAAADEAKGRLGKLTKYSESQLDDRITTIHSLTMGMTNIYPQKVVEIRNQWDKRSFCGEVGLDFGRGDSDDDIMDVPDDEGHMFFRMYGWLKSNMMDYEQWDECPISSAWPRDQGDSDEDGFADFAHYWDDYKEAEGIWEFDDIIELAVNEGKTVDANELFVDEVQDLYPLQQAFLDNQMDVVDRIWLAGDDDQTIYEWAGANPDYFINMKGSLDGKSEDLWSDKTGYWEDEGVYILDQSYRMPSDIMKLSQLCIGEVNERQEKDIKPHHDGGDIYHYRHPDPDQVIPHINYDDTFILFRANYQANNFGRELIDRGIPFNDRFRTWRESTVEIRNAIAAIWNDDEWVSETAAQQLVEELEDDKLEGSNWGTPGDFGGSGEAPTSELKDVISGGMPTSNFQLNNFVEKLEDRNYFQQEAIKNNVIQGNEDMVPDGLTLETIHWSKGREADTVILSLNTTKAVMTNTPNDMPDAERRLYYVGQTRAENELVLAESLDRDSPTFSARDLYQDGWREYVNNRGE